MTNPTPPVALTVEELDRLEATARKAYPHARLCDPAETLALIAAARRLLELESAIGFMNERGHWQNTWPDGIKRRARDFGWIPPGEQKGGADG